LYGSVVKIKRIRAELQVKTSSNDEATHDRLVVGSDSEAGQNPPPINEVTTREQAKPRRKSGAEVRIKFK
jgi:hypothetical protein